MSFINGYLAQDLTQDDVVWTYSGVRPLYDDGASSATAATRDYVLKVDDAGAPVLNIFGGKITTYRRLAESAMDLIGKHLTVAKPWTAGVPLPGGDFPVEQVGKLVADLQADFPFLNAPHATRLIKAYGTEAHDVLGEAHALDDLGASFGATLTAREVDWLVSKEWARTADDILWRRTKLGLRVGDSDVARLRRYLGEDSDLAAAE